MNAIVPQKKELPAINLRVERATAIALKNSTLSKPSVRWSLAASLSAALVVSSWFWIEDPVFARAVAIAGTCLVLWLTEVVPPYVPTLVLWAMTPLLLSGYGEQFQMARVLGWSANPVLALFLGGFILSVAASRHGIDNLIARFAVRISGGRRLGLVTLVIAATAMLSMWMSNIAAAAMMLAALHPLFVGIPKTDRFRRATLMGIAIGANFGGIATPIGTGPNAIAIAAVSSNVRITFVNWMVFAVPLAIGLLTAGGLLLRWRFRLRGRSEIPDITVNPPNRRGRFVMILFFLTVAAWLTEPLHGTSSAIVALIASTVLFGSGLLRREDIIRIDWSTLILIAGGIGLGTLLDQGGLSKFAGAAVPWHEIPHVARLFMLCFAAALLSALMSNTASVTMLIPLAAGIDPGPSTAILIAISASLGVPFVISTPPNAMIYGEGGITFTDLAVPGLVLMILGCVLVSFTGPFVLNLLGIP
ncbi:MAG TPA: DASS family sodium-coupled anion symporter [Pyrinomonadaceae bacterium]|nr:DASS family sodium-coupled anion symporter [Pyrinomonadaceae bacterium]